MRLCVPQIVEAMNQDSGGRLTQLQVDGGMTANQLLMQLQADILHIPVGEDTPLNARLRHRSPLSLVFRTACVRIWSGSSLTSDPANGNGASVPIGTHRLRGLRPRTCCFFRPADFCPS